VLGSHPEPLSTLTTHRDNLSRPYLDTLNEIGPGCRYVVDKMPENWRHLGLAHALSGKVKIARVLRDPRDVAISIYLEHFATEQAFAHSFEGILDTVRQERQAFAAWRRHYSGQIDLVTIIYEDLVTSPETEIPKLLAALGLDFQDACLAPGDNDNPVDTPSRWQVRQPISSRSVGRWRKFQAFAPEVFQELRKYLPG